MDSSSFWFALGFGEVVLFWFFSLVWFLVLAFYIRSSSAKRQMTPPQGTMTSGRSPACCLTSSCLPSLFSRDFLDPLSGWGVKLHRVLSPHGTVQNGLGRIKALLLSLRFQQPPWPVSVPWMFHFSHIWGAALTLPQIGFAMGSPKLEYKWAVSSLLPTNQSWNNGNVKEKRKYVLEIRLISLTDVTRKETSEQRDNKVCRYLKAAKTS